MLAIMAHRNMPDPDTKKSEAQVIYGRNLTDAFKFMSATDKFRDEAVHPTWREAWELKERANRHRFYFQRKQTNRTSRPLTQLPIGAKVFIQSQHGAKAGAWDRTGMVTEHLPHESYSIKVDGSGRISKLSNSSKKYKSSKMSNSSKMSKSSKMSTSSKMSKSSKIPNHPKCPNHPKGGNKELWG